MKKLIIFIILLSISIGGFTKSIGTVLYAINKVEAKQAGKSRTLTRGSAILTGDTIVTAQDASAQIKYLNGTLVTIEKNSQYQTIAYEPNAKLSLKTKLSPGAIEYTSSGKKKSILQTPVVALAIMGTSFKVIATFKNTYIDVREGLVIGNGVQIGPGQSYSSGSFDQKGRFTSGSIPWKSNIQSNLATLNTNTQIETTEIMPLLIEENATIAITEAIAPLIGVAQIVLVFP